MNIIKIISKEKKWSGLPISDFFPNYQHRFWISDGLCNNEEFATQAAFYISGIYGSKRAFWLHVSHGPERVKIQILKTLISTL